MHAVIVGNGAAGMEAARKVRERAPQWTITVVSEESNRRTLRRSDAGFAESAS